MPGLAFPTLPHPGPLCAVLPTADRRSAPRDLGAVVDSSDRQAAGDAGTLDRLGRITSVEDDWRQSAACLGRGTTNWFRDRGSPAHVAALAICAACPVRGECLDEAHRWEGRPSRWGRHGLWGGMTPEERRKVDRGVERASTAA